MPHFIQKPQGKKFMPKKPTKQSTLDVEKPERNPTKRDEHKKSDKQGKLNDRESSRYVSGVKPGKLDPKLPYYVVLLTFCYEDIPVFLTDDIEEAKKFAENVDIESCVEKLAEPLGYENELCYVHTKIIEFSNGVPTKLVFKDL